MKRSSTEILIKAMKILSGEIQSGDGVANAVILEAAERLEEFKKYQEFYDEVSFYFACNPKMQTKEQFYDAIKTKWEECQRR